MNSQTLARWIIQLSADAGINTDTVKQHSTGSALAAWIWKTLKFSMAQICKMASWSNTFKKFYKKLVLQTKLIYKSFSMLKVGRVEGGRKVVANW